MWYRLCWERLTLQTNFGEKWCPNGMPQYLRERFKWGTRVICLVVHTRYCGIHNCLVKDARWKASVNFSISVGVPICCLPPPWSPTVTDKSRAISRGQSRETVVFFSFSFLTGNILKGRSGRASWSCPLCAGGILLRQDRGPHTANVIHFIRKSAVLTISVLWKSSFPSILICCCCCWSRSFRRGVDKAL